MTFFANFGNRESSLAAQTVTAGTDSLQAASEMFRLFAGLEARESPKDSRREWIEEGALDRSIATLETAATIYAEISNEVDSEWLDELASDELEFASLGSSDRFYNNVSTWDRFRKRRRPHTRSQLYAELARRASMLASSLRALEINREARDLSGSVFRCMQQWENMASLARVIAVVNRRLANRDRLGLR